MMIVRALGTGVLAVGVAVGGVACGSSHVAKNPTTTPSKSNLPDLSDGMILPQSGFPSAGGEFKVTATSHFDRMAEVAACTPVELIRDGGQRARAKLKGEGTYIVTVYHTGTTHNLREWAGRCLPNQDEGTKLADLPGLPADAIGMVTEDEGKTTAYQVMGYVRGILVDAKVDGLPEAPPNAKSDVVRLFNNQAELLNSN